MTPKEKTEYLIRQMTVDFSIEFEQSKLCAIVAVDEIITFGNAVGIREPMMYWNEVKSELEKI